MFDTHNKEESRKHGPAGIAVLFVIVIASAVLLVTPGMLVVGAVNARLEQQLAPALLWIGAIAVSLAFFALVWGRTRTPRDARQASKLVAAWRTYFFLSFGTAVALAVVRFGFEMSFPETYLEYYIGTDPVGKVSTLLNK